MTPVYIDSDNAIASRRGDVDDGFAVAALLLSDTPVTAIGAVAGNTCAQSAMEGNREIARLAGFSGQLLRGREQGEPGPSEAARWLAQTTGSVRIAALGPLTNLADALRLDPSLESRIEELVLVGGNRGSIGRWPPVWPWEFNLWKDRDAAKVVIDSRAPLTVVPLDVAKRLMVRGGELGAMRGEIGGYLRDRSRRWLWRARILKLRDAFPVWDLVAAMLLVDGRLLGVERTTVRFTSRGLLEFGRGARDAEIVTRFDRDALWKAFEALVADGVRPRA